MCTLVNEPLFSLKLGASLSMSARQEEEVRNKSLGSPGPSALAVSWPEGRPTKTHPGFSRVPSRTMERRRVIDLVWGCGAPNTSCGDLQPGLEVESFPLARGPTPSSLGGRGRQKGRGLGRGQGRLETTPRSGAGRGRVGTATPPALPPRGRLARGVSSFKNERMPVTS